MLELQHKRTPVHSLGNDLAHMRRQISDLLCFKAKVALQSGSRISYESGDKCGKLLARKLREHRTMSYIPHIKGSNGQILSLPKDIVQAFGKYYSSLYNLASPSLPPFSVEEYLSSSRLAHLPSPARCKLDAPITIEELQ